MSELIFDPKVVATQLDRILDRRLVIRYDMRVSNVLSGPEIQDEDKDATLNVSILFKGSGGVLFSHTFQVRKSKNNWGIFCYKSHHWSQVESADALSDIVKDWATISEKLARPEEFSGTVNRQSKKDMTWPTFRFYNVIIHERLLRLADVWSQVCVLEPEWYDTHAAPAATIADRFSAFVRDSMREARE